MRLLNSSAGSRG